MLIIAEAMPDPSSYSALGWLLVSGAALLAIFNQGASAIDRFRTKEPNPPLHKEYATREQHNELSEAVRDMGEAMSSSFAAAAEASRQSREKIYVELRRLGEQQAAACAEAKLTRSRLENIDAKVDRINERRAG